MLTLSESTWRPPFEGALAAVISPVDHAVPSVADRSSVHIDVQPLRNGFRSASPPVQVDEWRDAPVFQKFIGRVIVICRVEAYIADWDVRGMLAELMEGHNAIDGIVALCIRIAGK